MSTLTRVAGDNDFSFIKLGAVGNIGTTWDEKDRTGLVQIFICHSDDLINSIQFHYVNNGKPVMSDRHGNINGLKFDIVELKYPAEYITWIGGHNFYDRYTGGYNLSSITFGTNLGKYGPFGKVNIRDVDMDKVKDFSFCVGKDRRQFGGFHGTADSNRVKSIGVYLKPITTLYEAVNKKVG